MANSGFCERHGPYEGATCPYCERERRRGRPEEPRSLRDDDATEPGGLRSRAGIGDEDATEPGGRSTVEDDTTQVPRGWRGSSEEDTELPEPPPGLAGWLVVKRGSYGARRGLIFPVRHGSFIGRNKTCQVVLGDPKVSKEHAKLIIENGHFVISDILTPQGTYVNGNKIREATALKENDVIQVGDTVMVLKTLEAEASSA